MSIDVVSRGCLRESRPAGAARGSGCPRRGRSPRACRRRACAWLPPVETTGYPAFFTRASVASMSRTQSTIVTLPGSWIRRFTVLNGTCWISIGSIAGADALHARRLVTLLGAGDVEEREEPRVGIVVRPRSAGGRQRRHFHVEDVVIEGQRSIHVLDERGQGSRVDHQRPSATRPAASQKTAPAPEPAGRRAPTALRPPPSLEHTCNAAWNSSRLATDAPHLTRSAGSRYDRDTGGTKVGDEYMTNTAVTVLDSRTARSYVRVARAHTAESNYPLGSSLHSTVPPAPRRARHDASSGGVMFEPRGAGRRDHGGAEPTWSRGAPSSAAAVVAILVLAPHVGVGAGHDHRRGQGPVGGRAARRDGRGQQPGPHREGAGRRSATVPASTASSISAPAPTRCRSPAGLQHPAAHRHRADRHLHRDGQRRAAAWAASRRR